MPEPLRTQRLALAVAVSVCFAVFGGGVAYAAEAPPSAVAQYMELLPTSTGEAPTRAAPAPEAPAPAPQPQASPQARETIRTQGGSDAAALERLVDSSPRSRPVEREPLEPAVPQGVLHSRSEQSGGVGAALTAIPEALGGWDAAGALVLVLALSCAALAVPLVRRQAAVG